MATFSVRKFFSSHFSLEINSGGEPNGGGDAPSRDKNEPLGDDDDFFFLSFSTCIYMCKFLFSPLLVAGLI